MEERTPEQSIERIKEIVKEADIIALRYLILPIILLFLNIFMAVYYEYQERNLFHVTLQTVHLVAIVILIYTFSKIIGANLEVKEQARKSIKTIEKVINNEKQK